MRVRKLAAYVAPLTLLVGLVGGGTPAHAGTSGWITQPSNQGVINYIKHPQNSLRPDGTFNPAYNSYQYACQPGDGGVPISDCGPMKIAGAQVSTDYTGINFTMRTVGNLPPEGGAVTAIPAPFVNLSYEFAFTTTAQEHAQQIGFTCNNPNPDRNTGTPNNVNDTFDVNALGGNAGGPGQWHPGTGLTINTTVHNAASCGAAKNADDASHQRATAGNVPVQSITPIMTPPHPASDGWLAVVWVEVQAVTAGTDRGDGRGPLVCQGGAPVCLDYVGQMGPFEGYSGFSLTQDFRSFSDATRANLSFSVSGNTVSIHVPFTPTVLNADTDLLIDDATAFPWSFGTPGVDKITNFVPQVTGTADAGVNTVSSVNALCLNDSANPVPESQEPIHSVGATVGSANETVAGTSKSLPEYDNVQKEYNAVVPPVAQPVTMNKDGAWLIGSGGSDEGQCTRGVYGLVTILDWLRQGFELRIYPRSPSYAPSTDSVSCRYPVGDFPAAPAPVYFDEVTGPLSAPAVDVSTSPYDSPWSVDVWADGSNVQHIGGVQAPSVNQHVGPLDGVIGKDQRCNYTYVPFGLHYLTGNIAPFTM
ncbi:MAG: hypothetical protein ACYDCC_01810 [Actinomycetota bacterium]